MIMNSVKMTECGHEYLEEVCLDDDTSVIDISLHQCIIQMKWHSSFKITHLWGKKIHKFKYDLKCMSNISLTKATTPLC